MRGSTVVSLGQFVNLLLSTEEQRVVHIKTPPLPLEKVTKKIEEQVQTEDFNF